MRDAGGPDDRACYSCGYTGFLPAMSTEALKAKGAELRAMRIHRRTNLSLDDLARWLNPIVRGWMNYYGRFYRSAMAPLLLRVRLLPSPAPQVGLKRSRRGAIADR